MSSSEAGEKNESKGGVMDSRHIVLATIGSLGDLHPFLALGKGLKARGHRVTVATSELFRKNVVASGLGFHAIRPEVSLLETDREFFKRLMDTRNGTETLLRELILPSLKDTYDDLRPLLQTADYLVNHPIVYAGPILADELKLKWASVNLSPISTLSAYDMPVFPNAQGLSKLRIFGPTVTRPLLQYGRSLVRPWSEPIRKFREEKGLPFRADPILEGQHSPDLVLSLWSKHFSAPQPDWLPQTVQTGFLFYEEENGEGKSEEGKMPPELADFLEMGQSPFVFTLGSAAVNAAEDFYRISVQVAKRMRRRAVLLTGRDPSNLPPEPLPAGVIAVPYAPYSEVFPKAACVIHSGGIGTTAQVLRAGKPQLIFPFANDQPDNAARIVRLGLGRKVTKPEYNALNGSAQILRLVFDGTYSDKAKLVGEAIRQENGVQVAVEAIEGKC